MSKLKLSWAQWLDIVDAKNPHWTMGVGKDILVIKSLVEQINGIAYVDSVIRVWFFPQFDKEKMCKSVVDVRSAHDARGAWVRSFIGRSLLFVGHWLIKLSDRVG